MLEYEKGEDCDNFFFFLFENKVLLACLAADGRNTLLFTCRFVQVEAFLFYNFFFLFVGSHSDIKKKRQKTKKNLFSFQNFISVD